MSSFAFSSLKKIKQTIAFATLGHVGVNLHCNWSVHNKVVPF